MAYKKPRMYERDIERILALRIRVLGGECLKFTSPGCRGVPDRIVMIPTGHIWFVELKTWGKKPNELQRAMHERLKKQGQNILVIDNIGDVERFIKSLREYYLPDTLDELEKQFLDSQLRRWR